MAGNVLKIDIRRGKILEQLRRDGAVSVSKLAEDLNTTTVTIRSDLDALEAEGYLVRVQGGAVQKSRPTNHLLKLREEQIEDLPGKQAIAERIAGCICDGDTLFINSGALSGLIASALRDRRHLNVVTNSLVVALELEAAGASRVILLGGEVNAQYGFTYGMDAQEQLSRYQADIAILATDGISASGGMTTYHAEEAAIDRMMATQAGRVIVAAGANQVGKTGFFRFHDLSQKIHLVTDSAAPAEAVAALKQKGVQVICTE